MGNKFSVSEENGLNKIEDKDINILSVGVSTGGFAEVKMLSGNPNRKVVATTIDEKGLSDKIQIKIEDVSQPMPYVDDFFDFIYARLVLHYLDREQLRFALQELNRILKANGKLYIVVRSMKDVAVTLEDTVYNSENGLYKHADYRTIGTDNVQYVYRSFYSEESMKSFLEVASFSVDYIKEYEEQLFVDYERKELALKPSWVLECLARK